MIVRCGSVDFKEVHEVINDAAFAYKGAIPPDRWHEPYMTEEELRKQIREGVEFWCYKGKGNAGEERILGVMGIQYKGEVTLIRHAYVRTSERQKGIGGKLLAFLSSITSTPVLIGTWADAFWAINFYKKHGYRVLSEGEKNKLLRIFWNIPERQAESSVVMADEKWKGFNGKL